MNNFNSSLKQLKTLARIIRTGRQLSSVNPPSEKRARRITIVLQGYQRYSEQHETINMARSLFFLCHIMEPEFINVQPENRIYRFSVLRH
jgi:hypothetical protein